MKPLDHDSRDILIKFWVNGGNQGLGFISFFLYIMFIIKMNLFLTYSPLLAYVQELCSLIIVNFIFVPTPRCYGLD